MAQDTATQTFTYKDVMPVGATERAYALPIRLEVSTVYAAGQVLALKPSSTTNVYKKYLQGDNTGLQLAECILKRACSTDASGNITEGGAATGGEWGQTQQTTTAWFGGVFTVADLVTSGTNGLDAAGATAMGGKFQQASKFLSF